MDNHIPEEIYAFSLYLFFYVLFTLWIVCLFTSYSYLAVSLTLFISLTAVYIAIMYYLLSIYNNFNAKKQREDKFFKPLSLINMQKEVKYKIRDDVLPEIGDLDFSMEFIEQNFLS